MNASLLRKSLTCGSIMVLVLLSFTPIIDGINTMVEKLSELSNEENEIYSIFTDIGNKIVSYDISENQLKNHLSRIKSYYLDYYSGYRNKLKFSKERAHDTFPDEKTNITGTMWIDSRNDYTPHDPIFIDGDDDFTEENGVTGGTGDINDPYIIEGWEISTGYESIKIIHTTAYYIIRNCLLKKTVYFYDVTHGTLEDIILEYSSGRGINIEESSDVMIKNSELLSDIGVNVKYSSEVSVIDCNISAGTYGIGINLFYSEFNYLSNLSIKNGGSGILSWVSHNNTIIGCDVFSNNFGIALIVSPNSLLKNNTMYGNTYNFDIAGGYDLDTYDIDMSNTINGKPMYYIKNENNLVFDGNEDIGFFALINCEEITVKNFITNSNAVGIVLAGTTDSTITSSTFNDGGYLFGSSGIFIDTCIFDGRGLWIDYSPNNKLRNIDVIGGDFSVYGGEIEDYYQDIDLTNTRDSKPIYYIVGENNRKFNNLDCGYLGLVSCNNVKVVNIDINYNYEGLLLVDTSGTVTLCSFSNGMFGIRIFSSSQLIISWCTLSTNGLDGVNIVQSSDIQFKRCTIGSNSFYGLYFENSHDNIIKNCKINNNNYGLVLKESWDNQINSNTFTSNSGTGVMLMNSWFNEIWDNTFTFCDKGVRLIYDFWEGKGEGSWENNVHHNTMNYCGLFGIEVRSSYNNTIAYNNIKHTTDFGIAVIHSNDNKIDYNNIVDNRIGATVADGIVDLRNNWWGSSSGPGGVGPGNGDIIWLNNGTVFFEPWLEDPVRTRIRGTDTSRNFLNSLFVYISERFPILSRLLSLIK